MGQVHGGSRLRSRLLVGVATVALAAPASHRALAQQAADKYQAHVEAGGLITNDHSGGDVDLFLPVWQDPTSLLFGDLRGTFTGQPAQSGSFGLGYRTQVDPEWILGGYGFFDLKHTDDDNTFVQGSVGLEALSVDWDFRVNGYFPFNSDSGSKSEQGTGGLGGSGLTIIGTDIGFHTTTEQEKALFGVDGEVGWRVPIFPADGDVDVRVFAGGFYYTASDVDALAGPRGRIEVRLYDLDFLGVQSRLTAQGLVQWDAERGTIGGGGLELRIPLGGFFGDPETKLSALDRRMVDRVVRNPDVIQTATAKTDDTRLQDVIVDGLTVSTHKIVFADGTGTAGASGTQANPTDLNSAPGKFPGQHEIIVAQGDNGPLNVNNPVQLQDGQALLGGGTPVGVTLVGGPNNGRHLYFTPPGTRPTVVGNTSTANLIEMASGSQNRVTGLELAGSFANGIAGENMVRAIITDDKIGGGAGNGVFLQQSDAGAQPSSYITIARDTVTGNALDGIRIDNQIRDGLPHSQVAEILDNVVSGNGGDGIGVRTTAYGAGLSLSSALFVAGNRISDNAGNGIRVVNLVSGAGAHLGQHAVIAANTVAGNRYEGIFLVDVASSGSTIDQTAAIGTAYGGTTLGNVVSGNGGDGIRIFNRANGDGVSIRQSLTVMGNVAADNGSGAGPFDFYRHGIAIVSYGGFGGAVSQSLSVLANSATGNSGNGIELIDNAEASGTVSQSGDLSGNFVSGNVWDGIAVFDRAGLVWGSAGTVVQSLTGTSNTVLANATDGVLIGSLAYWSGAQVTQSVTLRDSVISGNGNNGVDVFGDAISGGALVSQSVSIDPTTIAGNGGNGIYGHNRVTSATLLQTLAVSDSTVSGNGSDGIRVVTSSAVAASVTTALTVEDSLVSGNGGNGVFVSGGGVSGTVLRQSTHVHLSTLEDNGGAGIAAYARGTSGATVVQDVTVGEDEIGGNGRRGIMASAFGGYDASVVQSAAIYGNGITSNGAAFDAVKVRASAFVGSGLTQAASIAGNSVSGPALNDIYVGARAAGLFTGFTQNVSVGSNFVSGAGGTGILVRTDLAIAASAGVIGTAAVRLDGNTVAGSGSDGIVVRTGVGGGGTLEETTFHIDGNTVTDVAGRGIYLFNDAGRDGLTQGLALPGSAATIDDNLVSGVGSGGILVRNLVDGTAILSQGLAIDRNTVLHTTGDGIHLVTGAYVSALAVQTVSIDGNTVSDLQGDGSGILVRNRARNADIAQALSIAGNAVSGIGSSSAPSPQLAAGIRLYDIALVRGGVSQTAVVSGNAVSGVYGQLSAFGIDSVNLATAGTTLTQHLSIAGNSVTAIGTVGVKGQGVGIRLANEVRRTAAVSQTALVTGNVVSGIHGRSSAFGIEATNFATSSGGTITQALTIAGNSLSSVSAVGVAAGIETYNLLAGSGAATQTLAIASNAVSAIGASQLAAGIRGGTRASSGGTLTQVATVSANAVSGVTARYGAVGIDNANFARFSGTAISQTLRIDDNTVSAITGSTLVAGIDNLNSAAFGGSVSQSLTIDPNTVSGLAAVSGGVAIGIRDVNGILLAGSITQAGSVLDNQVSDVAGGATAAGIWQYNGGLGDASLVQATTLRGNTVTNVGVAAGGVALGIAVHTDLYGTASASQAITLAGNSVAAVAGPQASAAGIAVDNVVTYGEQTQTLVLTGNQVRSVSGDGIRLSNTSYKVSALISQTVIVGSSGAGNLVSDAGRDGIVLSDLAAGGTIRQSGGVVGNQVLYNKGTGLVATLQALDITPSYVRHSLAVDANRLDGNGVGIGFAVESPTNGISPNYGATGSWVMKSNTIQHNVGAGSFGVQGYFARQSVDMGPGGNTVTSNGLLRFVIYANQGSQFVSLGNGVNGNTMNGANLVSAGPGALQTVVP